MKPLLVMKFGGTSVTDTKCMERVVRHIVARAISYQVVVVVSAMGKETDRLVELIKGAQGRESDVLLATGEQVSAALLSQLLQERGQAARSFMGWQVPIETTSAPSHARIENIGTEAIKKSLSQDEIAVVAGFQGVSPEGRITTLGRGGSDTSAVALAVALEAQSCEIYTDVEGVFTGDPHVVKNARCLTRLSYEEMIELASLGARVLQTRSVALAKRYGMPVRVLSAYEEPDKVKGTLICSETEKNQMMEQQEISGITYSKAEAKITLSEVADRPGVAAQVFAPLSHAGISVDMIVQGSSLDGQYTDITFSLGEEDLDRALNVLEERRADLGYEKIVANKGVAKVSVVGIGMRSQAGLASTMFETLSREGINIQAISTSEIKISVLVDETAMERAVQVLHLAYGLEKQ